MDNFVSMVCQGCGDRLQQTAERNRYRCLSCHNEYLIDPHGRGLVVAGMKQNSASAAPGEIAYIPIVQAYVTSLKFFAGHYDTVPETALREYPSQFRSDVDYVYWEITFDHKTLGDVLEFALFNVWTYPDGTTSSLSSKITLEASWTWSRWWNCTRKHPDGERWMPGDYRVDFFVEGKKVTSASFAIYD